MRLYGAYGSNLNISQMNKRCPNSYPICFIYLENWNLVFKGVADLEKKTGSMSLVGLYEITKACEKSLDIYEEYPFVYKKTKIKKKIEGSFREIMFYTMNKKYHYAMPTIKYFKVIEEGFKDWRGNKKLLLNSCIHSIVNHTENGYKSKNWKDKAYINNSFLKKNFRKAF